MRRKKMQLINYFNFNEKPSCTAAFCEKAKGKQS